MDFMNYIPNYNFSNYREPGPWPLEFSARSAQFNLNKAITMIKNSVNDEAEDAAFYEELIEIAPNEEAKNIIASIRDDEKIHNKILRYIFTKLTGVVLPADLDKVQKPQFTYLDGIKKALFGELKAVEKYREIMAYIADSHLYNMLLYIMTDEQKHATKYNYLLTTFLTQK